MSNLPPGRDDTKASPSSQEPPFNDDFVTPIVASGRSGVGAGLVIGAAAAIGVMTFLVMSQHRVVPKPSAESVPSANDIIAPPPPPPQDVVQAQAAAHTPVVVQPPPVAAVLVSPPVVPTAPSTTPTSPPPSPTPGTFKVDQVKLARKAPTLIVDLDTGTADTAAKKAAALATAAAGLSGEEQFAERVGASLPERSRATMLGNGRVIVPQGVIIPAVLETALDSDLPGFARAVVSRDVHGFDGARVLIPRGSRLIGEYKSSLSQGQSRVFVIWTRILRPDGASIQIGSPGTDQLGEAGFGGKVDRHFFERFSGAILLSVLDAGVNSLSNTPSTEVVVGSTTQATSAQAIQPANIPPTIKVKQGAAIRIFVARDLDFGAVEAAAHG